MRLWFAVLASSLLLSFSVFSLVPLPWSAATQQTQVIQSTRDWINVRTDFGARGDGVTNDTSAFANAIVAFETSRTAAFVLVPPGTYLVDDIKVVGDLHLKGSGKSRTIIKARTTGAGAGIMRRDPNVVVQQLTVEDIQLQGFLYGIDARGVYYSEFRNLYVWNCDTGIYMGKRSGEAALTFNDAFFDVRVVASTSFTLDVDVSSTTGDLVNACQFHSCVFDSHDTHADHPLRLRGRGGNGLTGISFHGCTLETSSLVMVNCRGVGWFGGYVEDARIDAAGGVSGLTINGTYFSVTSDPGIRLGTNTNGDINAVTIGACTFAGAAGVTAIEIRPNMAANSDGIVILPNFYLGSLAHVSDIGGRADLKVSSGSIDASGYVSVSNANRQISAGAGSPEGVVMADVGSLYQRTDGVGVPALYVKESGGPSAYGWIAK